MRTLKPSGHSKTDAAVSGGEQLCGFWGVCIPKTLLNMEGENSASRLDES